MTEGRKGRNRRAILLFLGILGMTAWGVTGCGRRADREGNRWEQTEAAEENRSEQAEGTEDTVRPVIGLILTSVDAEENEAVIAEFQEAADEAGAQLRVCIPEVTWEEAQAAGELTGDFVLCDTDPIEYQMLYVDELVAEGVDVIAIHGNHSQALTPVLTAARAVGIRVCAFGRQVEEESRDSYTERDQAAPAAIELLALSG